jgi:hypothetical protein
MAAISEHPSLQRLEFEEHDSFDCSSTKRNRTRAVAGMLSVNELIDEIPFNDKTFDRGVWEALVVPRLDCNAYRKRFLSIQAIDDASSRAAVMTKALPRVRSQPWLISMLLSLNQDILCSYVDERSTREKDQQVLVWLEKGKFVHANNRNKRTFSRRPLAHSGNLRQPTRHRKDRVIPAQQRAAVEARRAQNEIRSKIEMSRKRKDQLSRELKDESKRLAELRRQLMSY